MFRVITTPIAAIVVMLAVCSATPVAALTRPTATLATACPFCSAIALTFAEQLNSTDIAVVAKLLEVPEPSDDPDADFPKASFEILRVLKGDEFVAEEMTFNTQLVGSYPKGQKFLIMGVDPPKVAWTTPMKASDRVFDYLTQIQQLPESGPDRLVFFQEFFEDKEPVLAFDAYDEFARAPYEDLIAMKDRMNRDKLLGWVKDPETSVSRRRLYFTMLGVCGTPEDVEVLEGFITSDSRKKRAGLDALIASYLTLKGEQGVDLIEKTFLADHEVDYVDTLAAVSALRFHGTEVEVIPKQRIVVAVRHLLDRPKMADMIIPDLARWEDWSVMERLVEMFKEADDDSNWLRVPVITYLRNCPKPEAKKYIEELRKIDPESVQRADFFLGAGESDDEWDDGPEEAIETDKPTEPEAGAETEEKTETEETGKVGAVIHERSLNPLDDYVVRKIPILSATVETESGSVNSATQISSLEPGREPNQSRTAFVTNGNESMASQTGSAQIPPSVPASTPVAATTPSYNLTWTIIFVPMAISVLIFLLLWSIVNGWFERLIF